MRCRRWISWLPVAAVLTLGGGLAAPPAAPAAAPHDCTASSSVSAPEHDRTVVDSIEAAHPAHQKSRSPRPLAGAVGPGGSRRELAPVSVVAAGSAEQPCSPPSQGPDARGPPSVI